MHFSMAARSLVLEGGSIVARKQIRSLRVTLLAVIVLVCSAGVTRIATGQNNTVVNLPAPGVKPIHGLTMTVDTSWPGGAAVIAKLGGDGRVRASWLGILDANGDVQSASDTPGGKRMQSPMYRNANLFEKLFRQAAKNMDELDIDLMIDDLRNP